MRGVKDTVLDDIVAFLERFHGDDPPVQFM